MKKTTSSSVLASSSSTVLPARWTGSRNAGGRAGGHGEDAAHHHGQVTARSEYDEQEDILTIILLKVCDDVMETAWSTMWNVTDETPVNCERFLNGGGMYLFLKCKVSNKFWSLFSSEINPSRNAFLRRRTC